MTSPPLSPTNPPATYSAPFLARRSHLLTQISSSLEDTLTQINSLNRSLEGIIEIGNEFAAVEGLWSSFEGFMGDQGQGHGQAEGAGEGREDDGKEEGRSHGDGKGK
jgi:DASH complex subunit DAD1